MKRELRSIADDLLAGRDVEPVTVRTFLWWFEAQRRGPNIVRRIRNELKDAGIVTVPDFEARWVDAPITFALANEPSPTPTADDTVLPSSDAQVPTEEPVSWATKDATYRISKLAAANQPVERINPDATLAEAVTLLLARDYSQLAVMTNDRDVKGMVSWRSIGSRLSLGKSAGQVQSFMENHHEVRSDISIFEAIPLIVRYDYVLVRDDQSKITGIVTASDLSNQFLALSEPFLLLSEIENHIRNMIGRIFSLSDLTSAVDNRDSSRVISSANDLTFGEYLRLFQNPARWSQVNIAIDRVIFCRDLDNIRQIRNDVTHFDPDGVTPSELDQLRRFKSLLGKLETIAN